MKGQADLISAVILVSVVLVMSISFLGYASSLLSQKTAESDLNNLLQREAANTLIYREYEDEEGGVLYLGVVRVDGTRGTYYYLAVNKTYCSINGAINGGYFKGGVLEVSSSRVYVVTSSGQYVPLSALAPSLSTVPLNPLLHEGGNELLAVGDFTVSLNPPSTPNCLAVILFTQVGGDYYEVGRYYETWE